MPEDIPVTRLIGFDLSPLIYSAFAATLIVAGVVFLWRSSRR